MQVAFDWSDLVPTYGSSRSQPCSKMDPETSKQRHHLKTLCVSRWTYHRRFGPVPRTLDQLHIDLVYLRTLRFDICRLSACQFHDHSIYFYERKLWYNPCTPKVQIHVAKVHMQNCKYIGAPSWAPRRGAYGCVYEMGYHQGDGIQWNQTMPLLTRFLTH